MGPAERPMRQLKRYKGWDLSARARTLWQAGLGFDSKNRTRVLGPFVPNGHDVATLILFYSEPVLVGLQPPLPLTGIGVSGVNGVMDATEFKRRMIVMVTAPSSNC